MFQILDWLKSHHSAILATLVVFQNAHIFHGVGAAVLDGVVSAANALLQ